MELLDHISQLTNPELDLSSFQVRGMKLGDSVESIPPEIINGNPYGGWLPTDKGIRIRSSEEEVPRIAEFHLQPQVLSELGLTKQEKIENVFGQADAIERNLGFTYYFYEKRQLVISWRSTLLGIYLGENSIQQTTYNIQDFLDKYFEFKSLVPDYADWNLNSLAYNEPRYYRLKELNSLMKAFELGDNLLQDVQNRKFLKRRSLEDFRPILKEIEAFASTSERDPERWKRELERYSDVTGFGIIIQTFMRFSEQVRELLRFNSGWLEVSLVSSKYSIHKTQQLIKQIDQTQWKEIEDLLGKVMDPKQRVFTQNELIKNYDFPDVDLRSIDIENY